MRIAAPKCNACVVTEEASWGQFDHNLRVVSHWFTVLDAKDTADSGKDVEGLSRSGHAAPTPGNHSNDLPTVACARKWWKCLVMSSLVIY